MNQESKNSGMGLGSVLFVVFLVLKLTDHIDWSWWWVTSPLWIPVALVASVFLIGILFAWLDSLLKF
jgi:inner membrane protein involved in colicin E2 resistance